MGPSAQRASHADTLHPPRSARSVLFVWSIVACRAHLHEPRLVTRGGAPRAEAARTRHREAPAPAERAQESRGAGCRAGALSGLILYIHRKGWLCVCLALLPLACDTDL